jgi:hypothetical protein
MTLMLRASGDPTRLAAPLNALVRRLNPNQPLYNVLTLERIVFTQFARQRLMASMMAVFAVVALLIAVVGIYSVMSYGVAQGTHPTRRPTGARRTVACDARGSRGSVERGVSCLVTPCAHRSCR